MWGKEIKMTEMERELMGMRGGRYKKRRGGAKGERRGKEHEREKEGREVDFD